MSTLTFNWRLKLDGVLTDAEATPTLGDSTATFGVRRTDTLATAVVPGASLTHDGTGLYSYVFSGAVDGITYEASGKFLMLAEYRYGSKILRAGAVSVGGAVGYYADESDVEDWVGSSELDNISNVDGTTSDRDSARIQKWLDKADAMIDLRWGQVGRTAPVATDASDFDALTNVAAEWTAAMLWLGSDRPESKTDEMVGRYQGKREHAEAELQKLIDVWLRLHQGEAGVQALPGAFQNVRLDYCDERDRLDPRYWCV